MQTNENKGGLFMKEHDIPMITKTALKDRGWTESMIDQFFPIPTKLSKNPYNRNGHQVKLYAKEQLIAIESTKEFQDRKAEADNRSRNAKVVANQKRDKTMEWVNTLPVLFKRKYTQAELRKRACNSYNNLWASRGRDKHASGNESEDFLNRISVNHLRHEASPYEEYLLQSYKKIGANEAREAIRQRILTAIAAAYPWLAEECENQKYRQRYIENDEEL